MPVDVVLLLMVSIGFILLILRRPHSACREGRSVLPASRTSNLVVRVVKPGAAAVASSFAASSKNASGLSSLAARANPAGRRFQAGDRFC
jgi:hypothetical protein